MAYDMVIPSPEEVRAAREAAGLNQTQAAAMVYLAGKNRWSEIENGVRPIEAARWELFLVKTGNHPDYRPARGVHVPKAADAA